MKIIHEAKKVIIKLWGEGKIKKERYRLLTYLLQVDVEEGTLIHNVITGEMILLDAAEMKKLKILPAEYNPWMDELIKKHFLVEEGTDEKKTVESLRKIWKATDSIKEITTYKILPTTNCNARCFYCYESNYKRENMSDETADKLVDFIEKNHNGKKVILKWFGGEPLVGIRQIDRICEALTKKEIEFYSSMISNGYLFDEEIAKRAKKDWKLQGVQITLDGTEEIYNEVKAYINPCKSPYQRVLDNIELLFDEGIHVNIRLNLGLHNYEDLDALVDELAIRFKGKKGILVYSRNLFDDCGFEPTHFENDEKNFLFEKQEELNEKIRNLNLSSPGGALPHLKKAMCMADSPHTVVVFPSGGLGKCDHFIEEHLIGCIDDGITNKDEVNLYAEKNIFNECNTCKLYPACIMLNRCEGCKECNKYDAKAKMDNAMRAMKHFYKQV